MRKLLAIDDQSILSQLILPAHAPTTTETMYMGISLHHSVIRSLSITRTVRKSCLAKQLIYCRWFSQFPWNSFLCVSLQPLYSLQNLLPRRLLVTWATLAFILVVMSPASHANTHGDCTLDELKEKARSACDHLSEKLGNDTRDPFHKGRDSLGYHFSHGKFT